MRKSLYSPHWARKNNNTTDEEQRRSATLKVDTFIILLPEGNETVFAELSMSCRSKLKNMPYSPKIFDDYCENYLRCIGYSANPLAIAIAFFYTSAVFDSHIQFCFIVAWLKATRFLFAQNSDWQPFFFAINMNFTIEWKTNTQNEFNIGNKCC